MQLIALVALIVGTFLYHSEMGWPAVGKYWGVFGGSFLLPLVFPPVATLIVQGFTVAVFFAHVKLKGANLD